MVALIIVQYFLSILLIVQIATKRVDHPSSGVRDVLIILIWLGGAVAIIYFFIKFLISIYRYKD
ncbi:hypothetical protein [Flavobacterium sp. B17]|uniref:hypothetical protein n=1 Tax=Flavobacterium sp. B17 TaxID=95618 RepID=UPI0005B2CAF9|nr:hypothetical protein [Flavobacterium sp. B17]